MSFRFSVFKGFFCFKGEKSVVCFGELLKSFNVNSKDVYKIYLALMKYFLKN